MEQKTLFKLMSLVGLALGGLGTLLSTWADSKEQEAIIEEKVNEALAARELNMTIDEKIDEKLAARESEEESEEP